MREVIEFHDADGQKIVLEICTKTVEGHARLSTQPERWRRILDAARLAMQE